MTSEEFARFYAHNKDRCQRAVIASGMASHCAEDAVAEAFTRAWARWPTVRRHPAPVAWVVRTAVNADISWWRKRRREVSTDQVPEMTVTTRDEPTDLLAAIRRLPPRQRDVVVLRYLLNLDTATTSAELGIAKGTVASQLHHALAALRAQLTPEENTTTTTERAYT